MDNGEIIRTYKAAKNKKEQVKILADLNQCKIEDIIEILKTDKEIDFRTLPRNRHTSESTQNAPELTVEKAIQVSRKNSQAVRKPYRVQNRRMTI